MRVVVVVVREEGGKEWGPKGEGGVRQRERKGRGGKGKGSRQVKTESVVYQQGNRGMECMGGEYQVVERGSEMEIIQYEQASKQASKSVLVHVYTCVMDVVSLYGHWQTRQDRWWWWLMDEVSGICILFFAVLWWWCYKLPCIYLHLRVLAPPPLSPSNSEWESEVEEGNERGNKKKSEERVEKWDKASVVCPIYALVFIPCPWTWSCEVGGSI